MKGGPKLLFEEDGSYLSGSLSTMGTDLQSEFDSLSGKVQCSNKHIQVFTLKEPDLFRIRSIFELQHIFLIFDSNQIQIPTFHIYLNKKHCCIRASFSCYDT